MKSDDIDKYLREKKITGKTILDMALLIELMDGFADESVRAALSEREQPVKDGEDLPEGYPYCKHCTGCGEDGCCPANDCQFKKDGLYCESYLLDLKFGYMMHKAMWDLIKGKAEKKKLNELFSENWDFIYKKNGEISPCKEKWISEEAEDNIQDRIEEEADKIVMQLEDTDFSDLVWAVTKGIKFGRSLPSPPTGDNKKGED